MSGYDPYKPEDRRAHRSLMDSEEVEWITRIKEPDSGGLAALMTEAEFYGDEDMYRMLLRKLKFNTSIGGLGRKEIAETAKSDDHQHRTNDDTRVEV